MNPPYKIKNGSKTIKIFDWEKMQAYEAIGKKENTFICGHNAACNSNIAL